MKVGFYFNNSQFPDIDCSGLEKGNPGIGGTWYMFLLVSQQLAERRNDIDVTLYVQVSNSTLTESAPQIIVHDAWEAISVADNDQIDYLVLWNLQIEWDKLRNYPFHSNLRLIPWCHNFCSLKALDFFYQSPQIARIINVGREQMDLYRDHLAFRKMDYIYNCVPINREDIKEAHKRSYSSRGHVVTYLGSLVKDKSFHVLARLWPEILKRVPDAELYVIGSGKVYNSNQKLGKYGIATEEYEHEFMPYITDNDGNIIPSVHFMGKMGGDKNEFLLRTKVGAPNPTGDSETFCISAVEMQALGTTVAAMEAPGYYDTFVNGYISKNEKQYVNDIVRLLLATQPPMELNETIEIFKQKFAIELIISDWEKLFLSDMSDYLHPILPINNPRHRCKFIKEKIRRLKEQCLIPGSFPTVERLSSLNNAGFSKVKKLFS